MSAIQHTAVRRAVETKGKYTLVRRGSVLCLCTNAEERGKQMQGFTHDRPCSSAGLARRLEHSFHERLGRVPSYGQRPAMLLELLWKYRDHADALVHEFAFWSEHMQNQPAEAVLARAVETLDAALWVAYRRVGRRWSR